MAKSMILPGKGTLDCRIADWFRASPDEAKCLDNGADFTSVRSARHVQGVSW